MKGRQTSGFLTVGAEGCFPQSFPILVVGTGPPMKLTDPAILVVVVAGLQGFSNLHQDWVYRHSLMCSALCIGTRD